MASLTTVTSQFHQHQHHVVSEPESLFIPKGQDVLTFSYKKKKSFVALSRKFRYCRN